MWFTLVFLTVVIHQSYEAGVTLDSSKTACACGSVNRNTRIVGGQQTGIGEYPWMVEIKQNVKDSRGNIIDIIDLCGAALVSKDYVITASHCFVRVTSIADLVCYLGDHDSTRTNEVSSITRLVSSVVTHPKYNMTTQANDIAVVRLSSSVTYQWNIQPICLPPTGINFFQQELTILGWGATEQAGASSPTLNEVTIPVIATADCKALYTGTVAQIDQSTVCAGTPDGSKDACQGDSGGPACWECKDDGHYSLGGVVSYGIGCGNPNYPGVFTNVSNYLPWIIQNTPGNALCGSQCYPSQVQTDCGWPNNSPPRQRRVVNGKVTGANKYPWMVSIYNYIFNPVTRGYEWTFFCAGSIISDNWVVTTAKCIFGMRLNDTFMVAGDYNINVLQEPGEKEVFPEKIVIHPNYNNPLLANDIALIKTLGKLTFNSYVRPVCLPSTTAISPTFANTYVKLSGWGRNATGGSFADELREVQLYVITNDQCRIKYGTTIVDSMFCTASSSSGDACDGDIGGPLMLQGKTGRYYAVGLQSFRNSQGCASGNPSGSTRVTSYLSWIESVSGVRAASTTDTLPA